MSTAAGLCAKAVPRPAHSAALVTALQIFRRATNGTTLRVRSQRSGTRSRGTEKRRGFLWGGAAHEDIRPPVLGKTAVLEGERPREPRHLKVER